MKKRPRDEPTVGTRSESDAFGPIDVPSDALWGAQTQRSINNFKIGTESSMPLEIMYGFAFLKKAAAHANYDLDILSLKKIRRSIH